MLLDFFFPPSATPFSPAPVRSQAHLFSSLCVDFRSQTQCPLSFLCPSGTAVFSGASGHTQIPSFDRGYTLCLPLPGLPIIGKMF